MNCTEARRHLAVFADDELSSPLREQIAAHLADCSQCRNEAAAWRELRGATARRHASITAPAGLRERVAAALRQPRVVSRERRPSGGRWRILIAGLAAAASFGIMVTVAYQTFWDSTIRAHHNGASSANQAAFSPDLLASVYERCACKDQHNELHYAGEDAKQEEIKLCAAQQFAVAVPDLKSSGFQLAGVCECPPGQKSPVVHAYYRSTADATQFISLFSFKQRIRIETCSSSMGRCGSRDTRSYESYADETAKVALLKWDEGGNSYVLCGELSRDALQAIADQIKIPSRASDKR